MEHNNTEIISILSNQLKQGNMVAFLGAGVSRTYINDQTGAVHRGLPASKEIVENLSKKKAYLERDMSFDQALFMVKLKEGRSEVERILEDYINVSTLPPLPAHQLLSDMPFSAFITTNFDRLLESALESSRKKYCSIIEDQDVCRWRSSQIPYIKLHGCITRPQTLIAAEDEYRPIYSSKPIIDSLLKTLLANKVVLFIGFSLHDSDFKEAFQELKNSLGNNMPRSYAIVWDYNEYEFAFWQQVVLIGNHPQIAVGVLNLHTPKELHPAVNGIGQLFLEKDLLQCPGHVVGPVEHSHV